MDDWWWSWLLTVVGLTGFVLAVRKVWWAWYVNIGCQVLWLSYALATEQYGFIVAAAAYLFVSTQYAISWTREHRAQGSACPVTGLRPCPWHPDGGNHPGKGVRSDG